MKKKLTEEQFAEAFAACWILQRLGIDTTSVTMSMTMMAPENSTPVEPIKNWPTDCMGKYERAKAVANERNLPHWIFDGLLYIQDGGKLGRWGEDGFTHDGVQWQPGICGESSAREATDEEKDMWQAVTGLES